MGKKTFESFIKNQVSRDLADPALDEALQDVYENEIQELIKYLQDIKETSNEQLLNYNIILFGPAGSGKSSFIRSLFNAYNQEYKQIEQISQELVIKSLNQNEGTKKYSEFCLKKGFITKLKSQGKIFQMKQIGINIYDTRGQVKLNEHEKEIQNQETKLLIDNKDMRLCCGNFGKEMKNYFLIIFQMTKKELIHNLIVQFSFLMVLQMKYQIQMKRQNFIPKSYKKQKKKIIYNLLSLSLKSIYLKINQFENYKKKEKIKHKQKMKLYNKSFSQLIIFLKNQMFRDHVQILQRIIMMIYQKEKYLQIIIVQCLQVE